MAGLVCPLAVLIQGVSILEVCCRSRRPRLTYKDQDCQMARNDFICLLPSPDHALTHCSPSPGSIALQTGDR
jgi:hypothetical protein